MYLKAGRLPEAVAELLQLQFTTGHETLLSGIHRVLPGETLIVESGRIAHRLRRAALPETSGSAYRACPSSSTPC